MPRWTVMTTTIILSTVCAMTAMEKEEEKSCWHDDDCRRYPVCRSRALACRCQQQGSCLLARGFHQRCEADLHCTIGMICSEDHQLCQCQDGYRYSKYMKQCTLVPNGKEPPRFADLPNADEDDAPEIPPTYGGPILVGIIGIGLVVLCLGTALWCRCTVPSTPVTSASYRQVEGENILLDLFYPPPPAMYQTPGYHNYASIRESQQQQVAVSAANGRVTRQLH